jgi:uncharacterized protein (DUF983 family)
MLALFTELPGYCPNCGTEQVFLGYSTPRVRTAAT